MNLKLKDKLSKYFKKYIILFNKYLYCEYLMSGTTAIDFALKDIISKHSHMKDVYLPKYRCYSIE